MILRFTQKERDAKTGLDCFGARYFSAAQGRWTSPDWSATPQPVPYADLIDPQTLNLYSYVRNNPLGYNDPDGHSLWASIKCLFGDCADRAAERADAFWDKHLLNGKKLTKDEYTKLLVTVPDANGNSRPLTPGEIIQTFDYLEAQEGIKTQPGSVTPPAAPQTNINWDAQEKHFEGHNSYDGKRSKLTANPRELAKQAGSGQQVGNVPRGTPGFQERVDFGKVIGKYVDPTTGIASDTTKGIIHYGGKGIHIVPARP